jgi:Fur family peroxide stress response transcriptional regulator
LNVLYLQNLLLIMKEQNIREKAIDRLLACGVKPSVQRVEIMAYLMTHFTHPTVEEVYKALCPKIKTLSRTTVYNTLRLFSERNAALMITIDEHRVCYDGDTHPHVHFYCKECGRVLDFMEEPAPILTQQREIQGNLVDEMQLYYKGVCAECMAAKKEQKVG